MELRIWIKVLFIVQILQNLLECRVNSLNCQNHEYVFKNGADARCCMKCKAGQRVKKECDAETPNSTQCEDCEMGTYMSEPNGEKRCKFYCDIQDKLNRVVVQNCTKIHDRKYGDCVKGFYENEGINDCMKCKSCSKGFGVVKECQKRTDTICSSKKCAVGTYSDEESSTQKCRPCTRCPVGKEEMLKSCTAKSNYHCRRIIETVQPTPMTVPYTVSPPSMLGPTSVKPSNNKGWVMPFFVSAMVLLIILFFGLVIGVSLWCHRHSRRRENSTVVEGPASKCHDGRQCVLVPGEEGQHLVDDPKEVYDNGLLIRHVSGDIIEELATYLNPTNLPANWKKVASLLNFKWSYINNLALSPMMATQAMLQCWATKQNSTVYRLYKILKRLGRDDAAEVLEKLLTAPSPSCPKLV